MPDGSVGLILLFCPSEELVLCRLGLRGVIPKGFDALRSIITERTAFAKCIFPVIGGAPGVVLASLRIVLASRTSVDAEKVVGTRTSEIGSSGPASEG